MKATLIIFSIALAIYANFLFCSAAEAPDPVLDIAEKKLRAGVPYYIIASAGGPGGMTFECTANNTCPVEVINGDIGLPLYLSPVNPKKGVIRVATDLNIIFCDSSYVWKVDSDDRSTGQHFLTTGGVVGNPGRQTLSNWFKLENFERGYKLVHCPSVCKHCRAMCKDVGIFMQNVKIRLALSDVPLKVFFREHYYD